MLTWRRGQRWRRSRGHTECGATPAAHRADRRRGRCRVVVRIHEIIAPSFLAAQHTCQGAPLTQCVPVVAASCRWCCWQCRVDAVPLLCMHVHACQCMSAHATPSLARSYTLYARALARTRVQPRVADLLRPATWSPPWRKSHGAIPALWCAACSSPSLPLCRRRRSNAEH